jgi:hypothetical protein
VPIHDLTRQRDLPEPLLHNHDYILQRSNEMLNGSLYLLFAYCEIVGVEIPHLEVGEEALGTTSVETIRTRRQIGDLEPFQVILGPWASVIACAVEEEDMVVSPTRARFIHCLHKI